MPGENAVGIGARRNSHRDIVLLPAVKPIGFLFVGTDAIKLCGRLIVQARPNVATIKGDRCTSIFCHRDVLAIVWINPEVVTIPVNDTHAFKCFSSINRAHQRCIEYIHHIAIVGVGKYFHVIPRSRSDELIA